MSTTTRFSLTTACLATLAFGCPGSSPRLPPGNGGDITVTPRSDSGVADAPDGGVDPDRDGGAPPDGGNLPVAPTITSASLLQSGRHGQDLQVRVQGEDLNGDVNTVMVRFLDALGEEVLIVDTDLDGRPDSGRVVGVPNPAVTGEVTFDAIATFASMAERQAGIASAEVWVLDSYGSASPRVDAALETQLVVALSESCDPTHAFDRCEDGLGCAGDPPVCVPGTTPSLDALAFLTTSRGPRILVRGRDADDDIWRVRLEFLNAGGGPVQLDLDADGTPDSDAFEIDAVNTSVNGDFVVSLEPAENFTSMVQQLAAVAYDTRQEGGNRLMATVVQPPNRANGAACDPYGTDTCLSGSVCYPGIPGVPNACGDRISRRNNACRQAPVLSVDDSRLQLAGVAKGVSLWDAPAECAALDPKDRPEGVALLRLPNGASRVTLTTDRPGTGFDTVLYVLDSCTRSNPTVLGCSDDVNSHMGSQVVLRDVAAGDYLIIVDSWNKLGGAFELKATIEP